MTEIQLPVGPFEKIAHVIAFAASLALALDLLTSDEIELAELTNSEDDIKQMAWKKKYRDMINTLTGTKDKSNEGGNLHISTLDPEGILKTLVLMYHPNIKRPYVLVKKLSSAGLQWLQDFTEEGNNFDPNKIMKKIREHQSKEE